ncbi:hybrid sensor histidine kinase/response regulator [Streptomyces collinus]|uniref:hybrid sensor histidine kinase/response regulator n=1 Tax=Streptomyces collinus TaxID=42684 RepID=UPI0036445BCA
MTPGRSAHDVLTIALRKAGDVITLRRCTQSVCRAAGLTGSPLVRLTTVVSEAGEHLLGATGLSAHLRLEETDTVMVTVRIRWLGDRRPPTPLLSAAGRLLDDSRLTGPDDDGRHELVLAQRTEAPAASLGDLAADVRANLADGGTAADLIEVLRIQNGQLLAALEESQRQQEELQRLNAELEETNAGVMALYSELAGELQATNTGVVALYAELEDKSRQLELANEYKNRFWANVSHELRSPVNSIIALARLLLDSSADPLTDEQRQQVALVQASGSTLLALVDELLDVAKAESGHLEPHPADVDLRPLLHQLRGTLRGTAHPRVELAIPDHVQHQPLVTDEVMLTRILRNVLSNALKFTADGHVSLDVTEKEPAGADDARFVFRVRDTGIGIPADELDRVFEEFYQVQGPHQRGRAGTGLGLPYARRLAELLGGTLTLHSETGHGTTVTLDIPARLTPAPENTPEPEDSGPAPRPAPERGTGGTAAHVVVIDDDETFLATLPPLLDGHAASVTTLCDSTRAVATVAHEQPDLVLLDLTMPATDGYTVHRMLAADPRTAHIPVVVLTALEAGQVDHARLPGVRAVLDKTRLTAPGLAAVLTPPRTPPPATPPPAPPTPRAEEPR